MSAFASYSFVLPRWRTLVVGAAASIGLFILRFLRQNSKTIPNDNFGHNKDGGQSDPSKTESSSGGAETVPVSNDGMASAHDLVANPEDSEPLQQGECVVIDGLQKRPELNGCTGRLGKFFPDKDRWAVQLDKEEGHAAEPLLLKADRLRRCKSQQKKQASNGLQSSVLELLWAGRRVRFFGIEGYASAKGADEIFQELQEFKPGVVMMESFIVSDEAPVAPGDMIPYREILPAKGLARAIQEVKSSDFRQAWTSEAVAVLTALSIGAEIRLGDRLHVTSFDRLVNKYSLPELKKALIDATEAIATSLEAAGGKLSGLKQNSLCSHFEELGAERHKLMAYFARQAAEQGHDTLVVIGAEHVTATIQEMNEVRSMSDMGALLQAEAVEDEDDAADQEELEKRAALAAFLSSTRTFPPDVVLPDKEVLLPEYADLVAKSYPKYREAFTGRISQAFGGQGQVARALMDDTPRASGLDALLELCQELSK